MKRVAIAAALALGLAAMSAGADDNCTSKCTAKGGGKNAPHAVETCAVTCPSGEVAVCTDGESRDATGRFDKGFTPPKCKCRRGA